MTRNASVLLALAGACAAEPRARGPEPGAELYAVEPAAVREVFFSSNERKMLAFRWTPGAAFQLVFAAPGASGVERCAAGDHFQRWLAAVARLPIGRRLDAPVEPTAAGWADLVLRDTTQMEPIDVRLRIPPAGGDPVVVEVDAQQYTVDVDAARLRGVASGCGGLGAAAAAPGR